MIPVYCNYYLFQILLNRNNNFSIEYFLFGTVGMIVILKNLKNLKKIFFQPTSHA